MANRQVWWYAKAGVKHGPYSGREMKALAAAGEFKPTDKVWKVGLTRWVDASEVRGLLPAAGAKPILPGTPEDIINAVRNTAPAPLDALSEVAQAAPVAPKPPPLRSGSSRKRPSSSSSEGASAGTPAASAASPEKKLEKKPAGAAAAETLGQDIRHKGATPVMESKTGLPWLPAQAPTASTRAGVISLGVPEDLLRGFVGPAYDEFYKARWQALVPPVPVSQQEEEEKPGPEPRKPMSLNWAAFGFNFLWLAYRKMYQTLFVGLALVLPMMVALELVAPMGSGLLLLLIPSLVLLFNANEWYLNHARRRIKVIVSLGLPMEITQRKLAIAGGTSWLPGVAAFAGIALVMVLAGVVLGLGPALLANL